MQRSSRSMATTFSAPAASSARVRPPGPGPISTIGDAGKVAGRPRDTPGEVEVEQEVLAERFLRRDAVPADDLPQRRQAVLGDHRALSAVAIWRASLSAAIRLPGRALPVPAMLNAVPWSGEVRMKGRPSVTFTASSKASVLAGISA